MCVVLKPWVENSFKTHILAFSIVFGLILTDATTITVGQVASSAGKIVLKD